MSEHGGRLVPDQLRELPLLLGPGQACQAAGECRRAVPLRRGRVELGAESGQFAQEGAGPPRGEGVGEPGPVDIGDGDLRVAVVKGGSEPGERRVGGHDGQAAALEVCGLARVLDHAATAPRPPRDRGGGQARRPAVGGEGVQVGVRRAVGGLAAAAPHTGDGREQDEGVQRPVGKEFVQDPRAAGLGRQHVGEVREVVGVEVGEGGRALDARRVDDGGERRKARKERRDGVPVRRVAGGDGDAGAEPDEFGLKVRDALGLGATTGRQHQVLGPALRQPARHAAAQGACASGDQDRAARRPAFPGGVAQRCGQQPAAEDLVAAHGDLVLAGRPGECRGEEVPGRLVLRLGQVDEAAPAAGVLKGRHPTEAPQGRLFEPGHRVALGRCHRARGQAPQRRGHVRVAERP
ncbi:hypothetical protein GCM10010245_19780 [Streptomyces spectabilis]|nr:hypothetical protein GCM10010245_19780 [Streptomyces spectabilis]